MITDNQDKFNIRRMQHKSSVFSGCLVFFKSTVGLGLLVSQYFFGKAGLLLGTLTTIVSCLIIGFTMNLIISVADKMEETANVNIENYDQITQSVYGNTMMVVTKIFCFLFNEGIILVNITNLAGFMLMNVGPYMPLVFREIEFFKLFSIFMILVVLAFILEPEMIKYPSYLAAVILFVATFIMWLMSFHQFFTNTDSKEFELFSLPNFPSLIGNQLYAFESIGTLFTVRSTLQKRSDMHKVLFYTFILIFGLFAMNGVSFLIVR